MDDRYATHDCVVGLIAMRCGKGAAQRAVIAAEAACRNLRGYLSTRRQVRRHFDSMDYPCLFGLVNDFDKHAPPPIQDKVLGPIYWAEVARFLIGRYPRKGFSVLRGSLESVVKSGKNLKRRKLI